MTHGSPIVLPRLFEDDVDRAYIDLLVRALEQTLQNLDSVHAMAASTLLLTDLPVNGNMQRDGAVFNDNGTLKVVLSNTGYGPTILASSSVGDVTVTTA